MHSAGRVSFLIRPYELQNAGNFTVSIDSVAKATGNSSSLELTPADFSSLTPSSKELTLSADGLAKVNSASDLKDATAYDYSVAFKFTTTSDTVSNKTVLYTSTVSLYKLVSVTKVMLENMIKKLLPKRFKIVAQLIILAIRLQLTLIKHHFLMKRVSLSIRCQE